MNGWIFALGMAVGFLLAKLSFPYSYWRWRLRHYIRRLIHPFEHRRFVKLYYSCQLCGEPVGRKGQPTKAEHFHEKHPEYRFEARKAGSFGQVTYYCLVCGQTTGGFPGLIKNHRHPEADNEAGSR